MSFIFGDSGKRQDDRYDKQVEVAHDAALDDHAYRTENLHLAYNDAVLGNTIQGANIEKQLLFQESQSGTEWDFEVKQLVHDFNARIDAFNKSEKLFGAQVGLNEYARGLADKDSVAVRDERLQGLLFQGKEASLQLAQTKGDIGHKRSRSDLQLAQIKSEIGQKQAGLDLGLSKQKTEIDLKKQAATLESQQRRAEAAFNSEKQLVELIQSAGSAKAKGQVGRSAQKNIQAIIATGGRAQAQLADQITRGDSAYNLTMMGLDKSLIYSDAEHRLATVGLTSKSAYADLEHRLTGSELDTESYFADQAYGLGAEQREATKLSIWSAYDRALNKNEFDEYGANLQADANRMAEPGFGPLPPKPLALPRPILKDPMLPIDIPEPRKGAGSGGVGAAQDAANAANGIMNAFMSIGLAFLCDMCAKHEVALLEYTEVDDVLSKLAFAVKELREHS